MCWEVLALTADGHVESLQECVTFSTLAHQHRTRTVRILYFFFNFYYDCWMVLATVETRKEFKASDGPQFTGADVKQQRGMFPEIPPQPTLREAAPTFAWEPPLL